MLSTRSNTSFTIELLKNDKTRIDFYGKFSDSARLRSIISIIIYKVYRYTRSNYTVQQLYF